MRALFAGLGDGTRGRAHLRLRTGFLVIAIMCSLFAAKLIDLQVVNPDKYALRAQQESSRTLVLPATRGEILDRNGEALATSVSGSMIVANPSVTRDDAPELATFLAQRAGLDYFEVLKRLRAKDRQFEYIARRMPTTQARQVVAEAEALGFEGLSLFDDPLRTYPSGDVAANLVGFMGVDGPLAGLEMTFDRTLRGRDGVARFQVGEDGQRIPLGDQKARPAVDGTDVHTTLDRDLQWFAQRVLRQTVEDSGGDSGSIVVMDSRTGDLLVVADYPTYDPNEPDEADVHDRGARSFSDVYEPGSVAKVLTMATLLDRRLVTPTTQLTVPGTLKRQDRVIHDWFDHPTLRLTLTGVLSKSSNIGTVLAADPLTPQQLRKAFTEYGLGSATEVGVAGESAGLLASGDGLTWQTKDRMVFGQALSVTAVQMTAAINTIANDGVYISPSLIESSAVANDGSKVGADTATTRRVVSTRSARLTAKMMERVLDPQAGVAPDAAVPGYRVAGKTGTAQRVGPECRCYDGTFTVSFAGFAPADDPRFTVYVVVHNPRNGGGGGSVAGPAFAKVMGYALRRYHVPPTLTQPSHLPAWW